MNQLHFAVCVGIDRYPGFPGRDLGSARGDALAFREWLLSAEGGGLPPNNVALITATADETWGTPFDARPQVAEINRALNAFNRTLRTHLEAHPDDRPRTRLYVYAAGHGIGPPDAECALLMADADLDLLGNNIELSRYRDWYLGCGLFAELVVLADCCRELAAGVPPANAPPFTLCSSVRTPATVAFTGYATRLGDLAWEPAGAAERDRARGYFTRAVLAGLGSAVDPAAGVTTSTTLAQYVQQAVEALTRDVAPFPQRAESIVDPASPIAFGRPGGAAPTRRVAICPPPGFEGEAVLRSSTGTELARGRLGAEAWTLDLPDGYYAVEPAGPPPPGYAGDWLFKVVGGDVDVEL